MDTDSGKAKTLLKIQDPINIVLDENDQHLQMLSSKFMVLLFRLEKSKIFNYWKKHHLLQNKTNLINDIRKAYDKKLWYACIAASFPLLDLLCRKYFNTNHLTRDITEILKHFKNAGIYSKDVKPGFIAWELAEEKGEESEKATEKDLRLVGIALGSFLDFASIYYSWYRQDKETHELNRHAIIHCAAQELWTKENATRILIFIDLTLRLEPVFKILLKEN